MSLAAIYVLITTVIRTISRTDSVALHVGSTILIPHAEFDRSRHATMRGPSQLVAVALREIEHRAVDQ